VHPDDGKFKLSTSWEGAKGLAEDVRYYGQWMRTQAERRIGHLYPKVELPPEHGGGKATVVAWIWARVVKSPNPAWDGPMPLVHSFALSTKSGKETWVQPIVDRDSKRIRFQIRSGPGCPGGTVGRNGAMCVATGTPVPLTYIRAEGKAGRMEAQLMAIVVAGKRGRIYLAPTEEQERIARSAVAPDGVPETEIPYNPRYLTAPNYGMTRHRDLFTERQLLALCTFSDIIAKARSQVQADGGSREYADAVATYLALAVDRLADRSSTICSWDSSPKMEALRNTFARQVLPMTWGYAEGNIFSESSGNFGDSVEWVAKVVERTPASVTGSVNQLDATEVVLSENAVYITNPPYYDNIGYADLSDFFYVWLRRSLKDLYPDLFSTLLVPKTKELVADPFRHGGDKQAAKLHFESNIGNAFERICRAQAPGFPITIIYAFKQAEDSDDAIGTASTGWETMLEGLLRTRLSVNGTWPLRSELSNRPRSQASNALASSIALVCRPRPESASLATRKELLSSLKTELPGALRRLQQGSIAPVDLAQAAIGPGMAVFSRYAKVVEADGSAMSVRTALGLINQVLDETLAEQEADFDADTRWAVSWFEQYAMDPGSYGTAETLSKAKNATVERLVHAGILESKTGKVRLLDRSELPEAWDPVSGPRLTVWELTQHMIRALESGGEDKAAELLRRVSLGEAARELAYRLYVICERKKWAKEAIAYNGLVIAWPSICAAASRSEPSPSSLQQEML
jgi:putative DNA methylase